ncbi:MAG: 3-deoxy-D-manno-octulosonic acid transferase [Bacteroidota bacterium]
MKLLIHLYSFLYFCLAIPLLGILSLFNKKIREGFVGRFTQNKKISKFLSNRIYKQTVLFHSSSVGEWEQSIPIIKKIKETNPNIHIVALFYSPSGMRHARKNEVDISLYLPFDMIWIMKSFLKKISPSVWIISKYDIWPGALCAAHSLDIPVLLASAELAEDSKRHTGLSARINTCFYKHITTIFPVSEEYKKRFLSVYPYPEKLIVAGDARYEQIIEKAEQIATEPPVNIFTHPEPITIVAGSIWPADEKHILPAFLSIYKKNQETQFLLVPHELHESHISALEEYFLNQSIATERYTDLQERKTTSDCRIVIVNTIGLLAKLYKGSSIAYVGGAFSSGVHNVAEPAVFGIPVLYGPKYINSHEAVQLQKLKSGFPILNQTDCEEILSKLISNTEEREKIGKRAQDFVYSNKGATDIIMKEVQKYID